LVTMELYKLIQKYDKIERYKNTFVNLALPYYGSSEPMKMPVTKINDKDYSMWDTFIIKNDMTLHEFMQYFDKNYGLRLNYVIYNSFMLYSEMIQPAKFEQRKNKSIKSIIEESLNVKLTNTSINLHIGVETEDENDEIELPQVLYIL
jgi:ubiquitin-activating enzyme E1